LVPAVVARGDNDLGAGVPDLVGLHTAVGPALFVVGHGPGAAAGPAAQVVHVIFTHFPIEAGVDTLLGDPTGLVARGLPKGQLGFAHVVARVVNRVGFVILMGIEFDPDKNYDERKEIYRMSGKIVKSRNTTQSAKGDKKDLWSTVVSAAVFLP